MDMHQEISLRVEEIEAVIKKYLPKEEGYQKTIMEAMNYSVLAGGKRLRPMLMEETYRMFGACEKVIEPFMAAQEMIHTYSLVHDDLPCMDNDDYRRGRLTNHKVYGEAMAVLAGDALLTAAFSQLADAPFDGVTRIQAVQVLAKCAGELGMVGGQVLDILSESRECTAQEVVHIQSRKTGALIRAACVLGVLAGQGSPEQIASAEVFADNLGLAFQIRDDMLDIIGDASELGKATGGDANKNTFVQLYGLEECDRLVKEHTKIALEALSAFRSNEFAKMLAYKLTTRTN